MNARLHVVAFALFGLGVFACQSQTNDNFENPPPGPPADCLPPAVNQCSGGSVQYLCATSRPDSQGNTNLVCDDGTPAALGMTSYCCAPYAQYFSDCTVDTSVPGCPPASFGFLCTGEGTPAGADQSTFPAMTAETPSQADAFLACSAGIPVDGGTAYCCNSEALPAGCAPDPGDVSCTGAAAGYSCVAGQAPAALDPSLSCTSASDDDPTHFCCLETG